LAGPAPLYTNQTKISAEDNLKELEFYIEKTLIDKKSTKSYAEMNEKERIQIDKIVEGRLNKWKKDICLLDQEFVKDPTKTINDLMLELSAKTGEKISIARFTRFELGKN
jgi:elongation factor Ts